MIDNLEQFETEVMKYILSENKELFNLLNKQFCSAKVISREITSVGFYINFEVEDKNLKLEDSVNLELGTAQAEIEGLKYGMGFVLFVRDGLIKTLEGYTYGEETLPDKITSYSIV